MGSMNRSSRKHKNEYYTISGGQSRDKNRLFPGDFSSGPNSKSFDNGETIKGIYRSEIPVRTFVCLVVCLSVCVFVRYKQ